jgi:hypothetical protein
MLCLCNEELNIFAKEGTRNSKLKLCDVRSYTPVIPPLIGSPPLGYPPWHALNGPTKYETQNVLRYMGVIWFVLHNTLVLYLQIYDEIYAKKKIENQTFLGLVMLLQSACLLIS